MTTERERTQVTEPEVATPEPEQPEAPTLEAEQPEIQEPETLSVQDQLADLVKGCVVEGKSCEDLGTKFDEAARELGIGFDELLDQVFEIITPKEV